MTKKRQHKTRKTKAPPAPPPQGRRSRLLPITLALAALVAVWVGAWASTKIFYSGVHTYTTRNLINTTRAPEAEASGIRSVLLDDDNGYAHYYLGAFYYRQRRLDDAEAQHAKALRTIAHPATPLLQLGEIHLIRRDFEKGLYYFDRTFKMNPKPNVETSKRWYSYGKTAVNARDYATAVFAFQESLDAPGSPPRDIHQSIGAQFYRLGLPLMATMEFEQQVRANPGQPKIYTDLATVIRTREAYNEGIRIFSGYLESGNTHPDVRTYLAVFLLKKNNHARAITVLEPLLAADPTNRTALYLMAMAFQEKGDQEGAREFLTRFLATNPPESSRRQAEEMLRKIRSEE